MTIRMLKAWSVLALTISFSVSDQVAAGDDRQKARRQPDQNLPLTDWSQFPQGYSILLNEKFQFPADLALWKMKIDTTRQLFVDNYLIARMTNLTREFHQPQKYPGNPVMRDVQSKSICPDPQGGYRLYGRAWGNRLDGRPVPPLEHKNAAQRVWLARSTDGITWKVPAENVLCRDKTGEAWTPMIGTVSGVIYQPEDPNPEEAWKLVLEDSRKPSERGGPFALTGQWPGPEGSEAWRGLINLYTSPDGLRWTLKDGTSMYEHLSYWRNMGSPFAFFQGVGDVLTVRWDPVLKRYVAHSKHAIGPDWRFPFFFDNKDKQRRPFVDAFYEGRTAGWMESDDLIHWTSPRIYAYPDGEDAKIQGMYGIYEADGFPYESMWLGCFSMSANVAEPECEAPPRHPEGYKRNWIRLTGSRDGRHWYYLGKREPFIPGGANDKWDAHYLRMAEQGTVSGPLLKGDKLWFYYNGVYGGKPGCAGLTLPKGLWQSGLGVATLRRDGFASLDAGAEPGKVITPPLVFQGKGILHVNAETGGDGYVKASVLEQDQDEKAIEGFEEAACSAVREDAISGTITWREQKTLAPIKNRHVRLVFHLKNAKLYSFWIE